VKGASYFDTATSFGMIRGKHVDIAIMGGLQVDEAANLANWAVPGKPLLGVGGAMDLASGAKKLIITMNHCNKDGSSKITKSCDLPITAKNAVNIIITDKAVFEFIEGKLTLTELQEGVSVEDVRAITSATFIERISKK
jgi:3-oxoacid CoA-transferase